MKIWKKLILLIIIILPINVLAFSVPELHSKNVIIYEPSTNKIIYEDNGDEIVNIASLTKIMTTIVAIENIDNLDDTITYTEEMKKEIPWDASVAGLKVGDVVTYRDLLYASMLPSGADATTALAYGIAGNSSNFVELMNKKAQSLGLTHTHFANVTGYDIPNHYSTPKEVLKYLLDALNNDLFKEIYQTKSYTLSNGLLVLSTVQKYQNRLDYDLSQILGSKTGYTDDAGLCMSALLNINGQNLIILTFGAEVDKDRIYHVLDTVELINFLNENYKERILYKKGDVLLTLEVVESNIKEYDIKANKDISLYSLDDINKDDYSFSYDGIETLSFRNKKNDKIGTINYNILGDTISEDVYLQENISISYLNLFQNKPTLLLPFIISFILLVIVIFYSLKRKSKRRKKRKGRK